MESRYLIDALSMSSKIHSVQGLMELFGLEGLEYESCNGSNAYKDGFIYDGVKISYNGREDMGVCIELSGQGCRNFETYGTGDYCAIFDAIMSESEDLHLTRLDVAFDDQDGMLDFRRLKEDTVAEDSNFRPTQRVSKFRICGLDLRTPSNTEGSTIYWGSMHSDFFIRTYDKAKERGFTDRHWIRMEMQLRRDYAASFMRAAFQDGELKLRETFLGVLQEYIRFVDDPGTDSNMRRWPTKVYWQRFLDGAAAVKLFDKPGVEYNIFNLHNYVVRQAGNAIDAYIKICGVEGLVKALQGRGTVPNRKYETLVQQCRKEHEESVAEFDSVTQKKSAAAPIAAGREPGMNYIRSGRDG